MAWRFGGKFFPPLPSQGSLAAKCWIPDIWGCWCFLKEGSCPLAAKLNLPAIFLLVNSFEYPEMLCNAIVSHPSVQILTSCCVNVQHPYSGVFTACAWVEGYASTLFSVTWQLMLYPGISSGEQNHHLLGSYTCLQALKRGGVLLHIAKAKQAHPYWQRQRWFGRWKQEPVGNRVLPDLLLTPTSAAALEPFLSLSKPHFQHWAWMLMSKHFVKSRSFLDVCIILKSRMQTTKVLHWWMEQ